MKHLLFQSLKSSYTYHACVFLLACAPTAYAATVFILSLIAAMGLFQWLVKQKPSLFPSLSHIIFKHQRSSHASHNIFSIIQYHFLLLLLIFRLLLSNLAPNQVHH